MKNLITLLVVFVLLSASFVVGEASVTRHNNDANSRRNADPESPADEISYPPEPEPETPPARNRGESLYALRNANSHLEDEDSTHNFAIETLEGVAIAALIIAILACCFVCIFGGWWAYNRNRREMRGDPVMPMGSGYRQQGPRHPPTADSFKAF